MKKQKQEIQVSETQASALPANPSLALQAMMQTIDDLQNIHAEETMALKAIDTKAFFALQERKIAIAQKFHDGFGEFVKRRDEIMSAHPDMKRLFARKQEEFSKVAAENLDAITRMSRTIDRLGQRIRRLACETSVRESVAYGSGGNMSMYRNKPITMGVNESA